MAEELQINAENKEGKYIELLPQVKGLINGEADEIANMSNLCAALKQTFNFLWVGFYLVKSNQLVLGPFQGPIACTRINYGKGVCGKAWELQKTLIVPNVDEFEGHIACSSLSKSEIVLPIFNSTHQLIGVLDVDSEFLNHFDTIDENYLTKLVSLIFTNNA
ncbi:MAG: GAF domain-containing protein [Bacteroidota bacterium]|jgi:L-methionine (R)-S-oxide reductase|nr:GAF domain-containing protein [Bacteroidota bacterium]MCA6445263.1 GAF domain-containing protein [Bacteroidota bacterium]